VEYRRALAEMEQMRAQGGDLDREIGMEDKA